MATESPVPALVQPRSGTEQLAAEWRRLTRVATVVAVLTAPVAFEWLHQVHGWSLGWSLAGTFLEVIAFRGFVDVILRRFIPWPSLFGAEESVREEDVIARRRVWFWRRWLSRLIWLVVIGMVVFGINLLLEAMLGADWLKSALGPSPGTAFLYLLIQMPILLIANFAIFFGPFLLMAVSQIRSYEPGDADWGVKLEDVRGQAEAKEEVRQVVTLWQSGEAFERAGGKRERGLLMLGAPGTGRRCSQRRSRRGSTARSCRSRAPGSPGCSSGWTRSRCASWPAVPRSSRPSGAASASSSSTRSTPWASGGRASAPA